MAELADEPNQEAEPWRAPGSPPPDPAATPRPPRPPLPPPLAPPGQAAWPAAPYGGYTPPPRHEIQRPSRFSGCGVMLLIALALGGVVAAIVFAIGPPKDQAKDENGAPITPERQRRVEQSEALVEVCTSDVAATESPKYVRRDPKILGALFSTDMESPQVFRLVPDADPDAPPVGAKYDRVGLIGCLQPVGETLGVRCEFSGGVATIRIYEITYRLRVVEARTGKVLQSTNFKATQSPTCPGSTLTVNGAPTGRDMPPDIDSTAEGILSLYHQG